MSIKIVHPKIVHLKIVHLKIVHLKIGDFSVSLFLKMQFITSAEVYLPHTITMAKGMKPKNWD